MASAKVTSAAKGPQSSPAGGDFDWASFLPAGHKAEDFVEIGGLTPMYVPEAAFEGNWPPVFGKCDRIEYLPEQRSGKEDAWTPAAVRVTLLVATKAMQGTGDDKKEVDVKAGEDILVPLTGNLKSNEKLRQCITDLDKIHALAFRVRGQKDIDRPSPMWDWEVRESPVTEARVGRYAFPQTHVSLDPKKQMTAGGVPYNAQTGEVQDAPKTGATPAS